MAKNFKELRARMSPEAQLRSHTRAEGMLEKMALHDLRKARRKTQAEVASYMEVGQGTVSKIEQRGTLSLGALKKYIASLGGELEINARFPGKLVKLVVQGEEE